MRLAIDIDSAVYKAGCSNETRSYLVLNHEGYVLETVQYKKEAVALKEEHEEETGFGCTIEAHKVAGPLSHTLSNFKVIVEGILKRYPDCDYTLYLGGEGNFRYDIYEEYKGHRDPFQRPIHEQEIRDYMMHQYNTEVVNGEEVDDRVSYLGCNNPDIIMVSIDKDLDNTPGLHYNYDKKQEYYIDEETADWNFALQLLTGDSGDNIPGLPGVGKVRAQSILPYPDPNWREVVESEYKARGFDREYLLMNGRLLWMRREPNEMWDIDETQA